MTKYKPDVIFLSEVRVSAASNNSDGKPGPHTKFFRSRMRDNDKKALEDVVLVRSFLSSEEFSKYKLYLSLANTKYAGTAMLLNTRTTGMPISVRYNLDKMNVKGSIHDSDGRVIVAKFEGFSILHTYVFQLFTPPFLWFKHRSEGNTDLLTVRREYRQHVFFGDVDILRTMGGKRALLLGEESGMKKSDPSCRGRRKLAFASCGWEIW